MREEIYKQIEAERINQDAQCGGPEHDDEHEPCDWITFVEKQVDILHKAAWGETEEPTSYEEERQRWIKIAALAVASLEAMDRME